MEARQLRPQTRAECYKTFFFGGGRKSRKIGFALQLKQGYGILGRVYFSFKIASISFLVCTAKRTFLISPFWGNLDYLLLIVLIH